MDKRVLQSAAQGQVVDALVAVFGSQTVGALRRDFRTVDRVHAFLNGHLRIQIDGTIAFKLALSLLATSRTIFGQSPSCDHDALARALGARAYADAVAQMDDVLQEEDVKRRLRRQVPPSRSAQLHDVVDRVMDAFTNRVAPGEYVAPYLSSSGRFVRLRIGESARLESQEETALDGPAARRAASNLLARGVYALPWPSSCDRRTNYFIAVDARSRLVLAAESRVQAKSLRARVRARQSVKRELLLALDVQDSANPLGLSTEPTAAEIALASYDDGYGDEGDADDCGEEWRR